MSVIPKKLLIFYAESDRIENARGIQGAGSSTMGGPDEQWLLALSPFGQLACALAEGGPLSGNPAPLGVTVLLFALIYLSAGAFGGRGKSE